MQKKSQVDIPYWLQGLIALGVVLFILAMTLGPTLKELASSIFSNLLV